MKSVGEAMAIGRNFSEALQKALRSLEKRGSSFHGNDLSLDASELLATAPHPDGRSDRHRPAGAARGAQRRRRGTGNEIDPWFIDQIVSSSMISQGGWFQPRPATRRRSARPRARLLRRADSPDPRTSRADVRELRGGSASGPSTTRSTPARRVRRPHAVPLLDLRRSRPRCHPATGEGRHPRLRPEPHRPGHRVRLRLRARLLRPGRRRATRPSWSTATPRPSPPTTTPPTGCTSSR